ncbi:MAG: septation protein A [Halioglobus sp.]
MKQLLEIVPIVLFFVAYQMDGKAIALGGWEHNFDGIFSATAVLMIAATAGFVLTCALERKFDKRAAWMLLAICVFGGATLLYRNEAFIQWKPTVFNWAMAAAFLGSQFIGQKNLIERALGSQLHLPKRVWKTLNLVWVADFFAVGALNLFVAFNFSEEAWVDYKLYSAIGFTLLLMVLTAIIISPHLAEDGEGKLLEPDEPEAR